MFERRWQPRNRFPLRPLHVPELDAGFHLLYELKPEEAHKPVRGLGEVSSGRPSWECLGSGSLSV